MKNLLKNYYILLCIPILVNLLYHVINLLNVERYEYILIWICIIFQFIFLIALSVYLEKIVKFIKSLGKKNLILIWIIYILLIITSPILNNISTIILILIYFFNSWFIHEIFARLLSKILQIIIFMILFLWVSGMLLFSLLWYDSIPKIYLTLWDYNIELVSIFQEGSFFKICLNEWEWDRCFNGNILWLKEREGKVYIYHKFYIWGSILWSIENEKRYITYQTYDYKSHSVLIEEEVPEYFILTETWLEMYSKSNFELLSKEEQEIFKELEENPTIVINWKVYK